jgi:hypothetical protein
MPGLLQFLSDTSEDVQQLDIHPEEVKLWLPSSVPHNRLSQICVDGLPPIEERLRVAQMNDALTGIRHTLRVKSRMIQFKNANVRGQREGTRSRTIIDRIHEKARSFAIKYRVARVAKMLLSGPGDWEQIYRPLADSDIRSYTDPTRLRFGAGRRGTNEDEEDGEAVIEADIAKPSETVEEIELGEDDIERERWHGTGLTRRTLSWIWTTRPVNVEDGADDGDIVLRAEWCKSRARAARAEEEVILLREEMRRTLKFLEWRANWWRQRVSMRPMSDIVMREALRAFALDQAALQDRLAISFKELWQRPLTEAAEDFPANDEDEDSETDCESEPDDN